MALFGVPITKWLVVLTTIYGLFCLSCPTVTLMMMADKAIESLICNKLYLIRLMIQEVFTDCPCWESPRLLFREVPNRKNWLFPHQNAQIQIEVPFSYLMNMCCVCKLGRSKIVSPLCHELLAIMWIGSVHIQSYKLNHGTQTYEKACEFVHVSILLTPEPKVWDEDRASCCAPDLPLPVCRSVHIDWTLKRDRVHWGGGGDDDVWGIVECFCTASWLPCQTVFKLLCDSLYL